MNSHKRRDKQAKKVIDELYDGCEWKEEEE